MSYTPTVWQPGDVITDTRLNKIEQGVQDISSGNSNTLVINCNYYQPFDDWYQLDKTLGEIFSAVLSGTYAIVIYRNDDNSIYSICPVTRLEHINRLNDTNWSKLLYAGEYYFYANDPASYPTIQYY